MKKPKHTYTGLLSSQPATKEQLAEFIQVSVRQIDNWVKRRRIPVMRISRRCVRFDLNKVLAALNTPEAKEGN